MIDKIDVLDHGFVRLIESWGKGEKCRSRKYEPYSFKYEPYSFGPDLECGIIEAARQSTQGSFRGWERDQKLLRHLFVNKHATPFEFSGMVIEVRAPIFVFREWHRHRTQSYNEMSARYAPIPDVNYMPTVERLMQSSKTNKQAGAMEGADGLTEDQAEAFQKRLKRKYEFFEHDYQLSLKQGVPKELARCAMPVGRYSQMRAQANLRNWLAFLTLRMDPNAQWEIRQFANAVGELISQQFPQTWALFEESRQ